MVNKDKKKLQGLYGDEEIHVIDRKGVTYVSNINQLTAIPISYPLLNNGVIAINAKNNPQLIVEPRTSEAVRTISSNVIIQFLNADNKGIHNTKLILAILELTGTITITMYGDGVDVASSNVRCSNPSSIGTWDNILSQLTLEAGIADNIELNFLYDDSSDKYNLTVLEAAL